MTLRVQSRNQERLILAFAPHHRIIFMVIAAILISSMVATQQYSFLSFLMLAIALMGSGYFERWEFNRSTHQISQDLGWIIPFRKKRLPLTEVTEVIITQTKGAGKRRMLTKVTLQLGEEKHMIELVKRESHIAPAVAGFLSVPLTEE